VSNLLLITDVARLRKIFGRLTEDKNIRLRIVNNLEKGGEEISIEKPDVVFVQTHLSGLSADILLMHLKKQLGRKRSRFVLLASSGQINDSVLKPYQGWLDTSLEDGEFLSVLHQLLAKLLSKPKKNEMPSSQKLSENVNHVSLQVSSSELMTDPSPIKVSEEQQIATGNLLPAASVSVQETSLEDQGITYAPRQRLKVYSEFNSSFDNAVSNTREPEPVEQAPPQFNQSWSVGNIETVEAKPTRSKKVVFLLWLAPVVVAVVAITYFQQRSSSKTDMLADKPATKAVEKNVAQSSAPLSAVSEPAKADAVTVKAPSPVPKTQDSISDKSVLTAISENSASKKTSGSTTSVNRLTTLPDFIPRYGFDKQHGVDNMGWERYKGQVTEFKVLREAQTIKAIQIIDRGGNGVPESFMKGVLRQVTNNPVLKPESSEKTDGYEIQRGRISENIKVVYYRDDNGGKLRAFVLTWQ
jgi:DNA-binding response OmpR family regulator